MATSKVVRAEAKRKTGVAGKSAAITKQVDGKGRIALGTKFANRVVLVDESAPDQIVITLARVIPEREAWLYENELALASVRKGLSQATAREYVSGPDLDADSTLAAE